MLIIFGLAALALLAAFAIVFVFPIMIVVAVVKARRGRLKELDEPTSRPDAAFVDLVSREWPKEGQLLRPGLPPG